MTSPPSTQRSRTERLLRQTEELSFLNTISTAVGGTLDLSQLLDLALEKMIALTGMEGGAVLLVDEDTQTLTPACERNLPSAAKEVLQRKPLSVGELIPGITAQRCQLLVVEDAKDDERELPPFREAGIRTHVCIPLAVRGQALGVLGMIHRQSRQFSPSELALFTTVGEQLGIAIDRARLFEQQAKLAERFHMLNELMRIATSTLDMAEVFQQIGKLVKKLIDHDWLDIAVSAPGQDHLDIFAFTGDAPGMLDRGARAPLQTGPGDVILTGRPIVRRNVQEETTYSFDLAVAEEKGFRSAMFVPLQSKGRIIGSLNFASRQLATFGQQELETAQEIADHLGVVLEHARLYDESKELTERLQTLNELMRIATSTLDMAEVFEEVGKRVKRLIDHDWLDIAVLAPGGEHLDLYALTAGDPGMLHRGARVPLQSGPGEVVVAGRPIVRRNMPEESTVYPFELAVVEQKGLGSAMFVPLESRGRVIGSLNFASQQLARYGEEELQTAQEIADHLAIIVEHALLYEESKQAEATLVRLNNQLGEASRHKSDFLASMSHELRTPLNAILGASQLLTKGRFGQLNDKEMEYVQDIHECGRHLLSLINDVLDLSKVEAGKLELECGDFDLHSLMERSEVIIRERAANKSLDFCVVPPPENIVLEADERRIKQVVYNLLSNAVKFTPENGRVVFRADRDGEGVLFAVEDTGPGVAEEFRERIFEEFFQTSGDQEGSGLGLALSKRLVELHGGRIWQESQVNQGSRFCFTIPIKR